VLENVIAAIGQMMGENIANRQEFRSFHFKPALC
jgi:hypothetical protein